MSRVISVINLKGGVGKTTTAREMGYILHRRYGYRVLMVDNDKQGNLSRAMGAYSEDGVCPAARLLMGEKPRIQETPEGLGLIEANMSLLTAVWKLAGGNGGARLGRFHWLREQPYDFVIIDNPPDLGLNVINALMVTDDIIVPTKIDQWALEGLDIVRDQIGDVSKMAPGRRTCRALVTMYRRTDFNQSGIEWLRENGYETFTTPIRYSEKAVESTFCAQTIQEYSPRSAAALSYRRFVEEYLEVDRN